MLIETICNFSVLGKLESILQNKNAYLALVGSVVPALHVLDLQIPVVCVLRMQDLEPLVVRVGHGPRAEDVPVSASHPRYLQNSTVWIVLSVWIYTRPEWLVEQKARYRYWFLCNSSFDWPWFLEYITALAL